MKKAWKATWDSFDHSLSNYQSICRPLLLKPCFRRISGIGWHSSQINCFERTQVNSRISYILVGVTWCLKCHFAFVVSFHLFDSFQFYHIFGRWTFYSRNHMCNHIFVFQLDRFQNLNLNLSFLNMANFDQFWMTRSEGNLPLLKKWPYNHQVEEVHQHFGNHQFYWQVV